jgi:transcriptional regulator with XRE-family HTH domain
MAITSQATTCQGAQKQRSFLTMTWDSEPTRAWRAARSAGPYRSSGLAQPSPAEVLEQFPKWANREYRQAYVEAAIEQGLAWQIRANRKSRELSQEQLAQQIGTQQSAISRLEDPTYGSHSIETLLTLAHTFDCALSVRFVPYSTLARESLDLSPRALIAAPFATEWTNTEGNHDSIE